MKLLLRDKTSLLSLEPNGCGDIEARLGVAAH